MPALRPLLRRAQRVGDDEERQLANQRSALDVRDELRRVDEPTVGKDAADESLGRVRRAGGEVDDRLIDDEQLVLLEGGLDVAHDAGVDAAPEEHGLVADVALRRVHLTVGTGEKLLGRRAVVGKHGEADAPVDLDAGRVDPERPAERVAQPANECAGALVAPCPDREHDELVTADAGDRVRFPDDRFEAPREGLQHDVARPVPADVVDVLEPVQVDGDQREGLARTAGAPDRLLDAVVEQHAVRKVRERDRGAPRSAPCRRGG